MEDQSSLEYTGAHPAHENGSLPPMTELAGSARRGRARPGTAHLSSSSGFGGPDICAHIAPSAAEQTAALSSPGTWGSVALSFQK